MAAIRVYGPYHRANNLSRALRNRRVWLTWSAAVAAVFLIAALV